jgi:Nitrate and nitrite sensing
MSGTALDHRLVREYLRELDTALRGLPAAQALELREQVTAHLEDALRPEAGDQEVAEILRRLGSPAGLAAEVPQVIRIYTSNLIGPANTFSAAVSYATSDARWQDTVTTLAALLRAENDQSVQRAILYAALSAQPPVLAPENLSSLQQAAEQEVSDLTAFNASAGLTEQQLLDNTVAGAVVDRAAAQETLAEQEAAARPSAPLTRNAGLDAGTWYGEVSTTIADMGKVASQLTGQITGQANTLKSDATKSLLFTSVVTLVLLLMLLVSAVLARPLRQQQAGTLDAVTG